MIEPGTFAIVLATRISGVVPPGFAVEAHAGSISIRHGTAPGTETDLATILVAGGGGDDALRAGVWAVLSSVQDYIVEQLKASWPNDGSGRDLALPGVGIERRQLLMWYGERRHPSMVIPSIALE